MGGLVLEKERALERFRAVVVLCIVVILTTMTVGFGLTGWAAGSQSRVDDLEDFITGGGWLDKNSPQPHLELFRYLRAAPPKSKVHFNLHLNCDEMTHRLTLRFDGNVAEFDTGDINCSPNGMKDGTADGELVGTCNGMVTVPPTTVDVFVQDGEFATESPGSELSRVRSKSAKENDFAEFDIGTVNGMDEPCELHVFGQVQGSIQYHQGN